MKETWNWEVRENDTWNGGMSKRNKETGRKEVVKKGKTQGNGMEECGRETKRIKKERQ